MEKLKNLLAIDVETSGPNALRHKVLSISLVPVLNPLYAHTIFIRQAEESIEWSEVGKNYFEKYRSDWERQAISPEQAFYSIQTYCESFSAKSLTLVGHNVGFDYSFLMQLPVAVGKDKFDKISYRTVDTYSLLYGLFLKGQIDETALTSAGAFAYFDVVPPTQTRHTSLGDAEAAAKLFLRINDFTKDC